MFRLNLFKKHRKYPIKWDEYGVSARKRAFKLFDQGMRPAQIAGQVGISKETSYRYFEDWKKQPHDFNTNYKLLSRYLHNNTKHLETFSQSIAEVHGMSVEQVVEKLQTPHGLKQFMKGEWPNYAEKRRQAEHEHRLKVAEEIIWLVDRGIFTPERLGRLIEKRKKEDAEIKVKYDKLKEG